MKALLRGNGRRTLRGVAVMRMPLAIFGAITIAALASAPTIAAVGAPGFTISAVSGPTVFSAEQSPDDYSLIVTNSGSEPTDGSSIRVADTLPAGLVLGEIGGVAGAFIQKVGIEEAEHEQHPLSCEATTVTCTYDGVLQPGEHIIVFVTVGVAPGAVGPVTDSATVSGGGAGTMSTNVTTDIGSAAESLAEPFGLAYLSQQVVGPDGLLDNQAGDHPFEQTLSFSLNTVNRGGGDYESAGGINGEVAHLKDVVVDVPPGFVGDPDVVEKCTQYDVSQGACPAGSQIGIARIGVFGRATQIDRANGSGGQGSEYPIYNVVPDKGYPAEFVIELLGTIPISIYAEVNPETNYGVRLITPDIPGTGAPQDISATFFGTPVTDPDLYNPQRSAAGTFPAAFLDSPTECSAAPSTTTVSVDAWERPGRWLADGEPDLVGPNWVSASTTAFPSLEGCELLQFNPSIAVTPETTQADEPTGVNVDLKIPQAPQQFPALVTPALEDTTVTLPAGMSISPSAGDGLQACSDAQIALLSEPAGSCPPGSQIGTAKIFTPLLPEPLEGHVFLGTPGCNPCTNADAADGNMFRIFLEVAGEGVVVKKEGRIYANTATGQLTTTFKDTPPVPVSDIQLQFKAGLRAALATPQTCGAFTTTSDLTPWSTPITPDAAPSSTFDVDWDGNGGACPASQPFAPSFSAGTSNPNAGQFSPFTLTFGREDREQDLAGIQVHMPPGLSGIIAGVPLCGEPHASLGTCGEASRLGNMTVAAGPGSHPFYERGAIYLTGPYGGAPFGLSIVVPTVAGPFNLGNVVVRAKIDVDPTSTALTVTSDPFPQILDGIPLRLRAANVTIDRPGFIFNPTDCAQQHVIATITAAQGAVANVSAPFAVAGCAGLHFGPEFRASTAGKTSRADGASLDVKLAFPAGAQSNIAKVKVDLPKQLPSRLTTLQKACPAQTFGVNPASCPAASIIGLAKAVSPLLPVPLTGPVYFVSHGGEAFPDIVIILEGYGVRVDLTGSTFISRQGITSTTLNTVPDVPVSSFELYLPEGRGSALAANGNLCKAKLAMPTSLTAQDGAQVEQNTKVTVTGCPKAKAKSKASKARSAHRARKARTARLRHGGHRRSK
jgi:hypothetical protein